MTENYQIIPRIEMFTFPTALGYIISSVNYEVHTEYVSAFVLTNL